MAFTYRYATESDVDAIVAIEEAAMSAPWNRDNYLEAINSEHAFILVAAEADVIAGFAVFYLTPPESELPDIVVSEKYRGQGIGRALLSESIALLKAQGIDTIFLEVRVSNTPARTLYTHTGFVEIGKRKYFYSNPIEDAICMSYRMEE
ncbi:ribosomal-protein-alanine N-acetyltransferase [Pseudobutyrivibrio sp. OR37]|uniref:ribosomal protein S18-alanine N-acetyltransferase n=1 Tax=Pseudobutyrivibrio sp. OR37 TaxID=1798186 RepID=UPI0008DFE8B8|nr:ribosomal protein S18-alanine N-acetyltransferase [Pseudobutyrivibrio sp. OR37]SFI37386.1 ribosomal-protein-alanine N-acetyltransferase [Pseudobutyrivibrio sp. OR37]